MKIRYLFAFLLIISSSLMAQMPVPEKTIKRILPDDTKEKTNLYYKNEIEQAKAMAEAARKARYGDEQKLEQYEAEIERLKAENEDLKSSDPDESPAEIGSKLGNVPGNNRTQARSTSRITSSRSKLVFAVSKEEAEPMTVVPAGSWVRARILTGVQANSKYPYNVLMQLDYAYTGPNQSKIPLDGCLIIGGAIADLSIERVIVSPHTLSCVRDNKEYIQRKVQGFVAGRDSSNGIQGIYDSKQSKVFLAAILSGIVKGASEAYEIANTSTSLASGAFGSQTPVTNFEGNFRDLAIARGVGKPAEMVTDWYLNQAKALLPTIHVGSGQDIWIVMTDSVEVPDLNAWDF